MLRTIVLYTHSRAHTPRPCFLSCANKKSLWLQIATTDSICFEKLKSCLMSFYHHLSLGKRSWFLKIWFHLLNIIWRHFACTPKRCLVNKTAYDVAQNQDCWWHQYTSSNTTTTTTTTTSLRPLYRSTWCLQYFDAVSWAAGRASGL